MNSTIIYSITIETGSPVLSDWESPARSKVCFWWEDCANMRSQMTVLVKRPEVREASSGLELKFSQLDLYDICLDSW